MFYQTEERILGLCLSKTVFLNGYRVFRWILYWILLQTRIIQILYGESRRICLKAQRMYKCIFPCCFKKIHSCFFFFFFLNCFNPDILIAVSAWCITWVWRLNGCLAVDWAEIADLGFMHFLDLQAWGLSLQQGWLKNLWTSSWTATVCRLAY